jgi:hypothetical protein
MADVTPNGEKSLDLEKWAREVEIRKLELELKREMSRADIEIRNRELDLRQRERDTADGELKLKREEMDRSKWNNPVVVAIFAAALAGLMNIIGTSLNDYFQRETERTKAKATDELEKGKAESARILEMIRTGDKREAAGNLQFLVDAGLIADKERVDKIKAYVLTHGSPVLPVALSQSDTRPIPPNVHVVNLNKPLPDASPFHLESDPSIFGVSYSVNGSLQVADDKLSIKLNDGKIAMSKSLSIPLIVIDQLMFNLCYNAAGSSRNVYPKVSSSNTGVSISKQLPANGEIKIPPAQIQIDLTPEIKRQTVWLCSQLSNETGATTPAE